MKSKVIFLHAPSMEWTIDYYSFRSGEKFKGMFLDPGLHYVCYGTTQQKGFFMEIKEDLVVFDYRNEEFVLERDPEQLDRIRQHLGEFEPFLGTMEDKNNQIWNKLVQYVSLDNLKAIPTQLTPFGTHSIHSEKIKHPDASNCPSSQVDEGSSDWIRFIPIELKKSFPSDLSLRTKYSIDKSFLLNSILETHSVEYLLGELALSFVLFQVAQIFDGTVVLNRFRTMESNRISALSL
jgi:hypothetical protein